MKNIKKTLFIVAACAVFTTLFSSCEALFTILMSEPECLYISDDTGLLGKTPVQVTVYKLDSRYNVEGDAVIEKQPVYIGGGREGVIRIYGTMTANNYYEVMLEFDNGNKPVIYLTGDPNLSRKSTRCYFKAELGYNYRLNFAGIDRVKTAIPGEYEYYADFELTKVNK